MEPRELETWVAELRESLAAGDVVVDGDRVTFSPINVSPLDIPPWPEGYSLILEKLGMRDRQVVSFADPAPIDVTFRLHPELQYLEWTGSELERAEVDLRASHRVVEYNGGYARHLRILDGEVAVPSSVPSPSKLDVVPDEDDAEAVRAELMDSMAPADLSDLEEAS